MAATLTFKRTLIMFGVLLGGLQAILLVLTLAVLGHLNHGVSVDYPNANDFADEMMKARYYSVQIQQFMTDASLTGDQDSYTQGKENYMLLLQTLDKAAVLRPENQRTFDEMKVKATALYNCGLAMTDAYLKNGKAAGDAIMKRPDSGFDASTDALNGQLDALYKQATADFSQVQDGMVSMGAQVRLEVAGGALLVLALFVVLTWWLYRLFILPLAAMRTTVVSVCDHLDFTQRASVARHDEVGDTVEAFNRLLEKMQDSLRTLSQGVQQVGNVVGRLTQDSGLVSASCEKQSDAAASMASDVEQMSVSISRMADQADGALQVSSQSGSLAHSGRSVIESTVSDIHQISSSVKRAAQSIHGLEASSQEISAVVGVIGDIADQTNLLALNAAIEAARAGEAGRSFAVVADEVRKLAERTSKSTREIAQTIQAMRDSAATAVSGTDEAVRLVDQGVARAGEVTETIAKIEESSAAAANMASEISAAIREQGSVSADISGKIERVADMTRDNSATARDTHAVANELDALSRHMQGVISAYRL